MLLAVESHPAMLFYLDNAGSIGPNSTAGINRNRGLNENLAREILELHTLGVARRLHPGRRDRFRQGAHRLDLPARLDNPEHGGEFVFNRRLHEPGPQTVLGKVYADERRGAGPCRAARPRRDIPPPPNTSPPSSRAISWPTSRRRLWSSSLARTFTDTDGDLKEVSRALVAAPEAWAAPRIKLKRPSEWVIAMVRAVGYDRRPRALHRRPGDPRRASVAPAVAQGSSPTIAAAWIDGLGQRLDVANNFAERIAGRVDPQAILEHSLGALASAETRSAVARAESRQQALALLFMSPEFQRR